MRNRPSFLGAFFKRSPTRPNSVKIAWRRTNPTTDLTLLHDSVRIAVSAFLALILLCEFARADNYYVNASTGSNSSGNGTQSTPWKTITYALNQISGSGHTLNVAAGTYNAALGETFPIMMNNGVSLVGAGMGVSIIDAGATSSVIRCISIVDASTKVEGFTIKGGSSSLGGGFYLSAGSALMIMNNKITGNSGAGIYAENSSPLIKGNQITDNIYSVGVNVTGSTSAPRIVNNVIAKNSTGIGCSGSSHARIINNTISEGSYGINISSAQPDSIFSNIIALNSGYGVYETGATSDPGKVWYNLFHANTSGLYHDEGTTDYYTASSLNSSVSECKSNIEGDPLFVDRSNGNYHERVGSPAIDAGDPTFEYSNEPSPNGGRINIGAYGNTTEATTSNPAPNTPNSLYVDATSGSNTTGDGSQAKPWKTITYALGQITGTGHTVNVAAGTYNTTLGETFPIFIANGVSLVGAGIDRSIIDAGTKQTAVKCVGIVDSTTRLDGFTITNGTYPGESGIYISAGSTLQVSNNKITASGGNTAYNLWKGGIYVVNSSPLIISNNISGNSGSGIFVSNCSPTIKNNLITGNSGNSYRGGGLTIEGSSSRPAISYNIIVNNSLEGIRCNNSSRPQIINNTIAGNSGGGIQMGGFAAGGASPDIINNILAFNTGYGVDENVASVPGKVWYNLFYANGSGLYRDAGTTDYYTSATMNSGVAECKNNLDGDPMFVDRVNGDYRLRSGSPAINAGDPGTPLDPDGTRADIGALYYVPIATVPSAPPLSSPSNTATSQPTTLTLTWGTSTGATKYHPQVSTTSAYTTVVVNDSTLTGTSRLVGPLANSTMHYWRVRAGNSAGWSAFSGNWSFTTVSSLPVVSTSAATNAAATTVTLNGSVNPGGIATTAWFEWGTSNTLLTYAATSSQSLGSGTGAVAVTATLTGLNPSTTYYYRAVGQNSAGIQRGGILSLVTSGAAPAWAVQSSGVSASLFSVKAVNAYVAWACGAKGTVLRTTDGGTTWMQTSPLVSSLNCYNIEARDANIAWVVAHDPNSIVSVLFKTTNGGSTWTQQLTSNDPNTFYDDVRFYDASNGILLGDPEGGYFVIYTTTNGGNSWTRTASANIPAPLTGEYGLTNNMSIFGNSAWFSTVNIAGSYPRVFRSTDRGKTWTAGRFTTALGTELSTTAFASETVGLVQGITGDIIRTTNGGVDWSSPISIGATWGGSIDFATPTAAVYVGFGGRCSLSLDGGLTWVSRTTPDTTGIYRVSFSSSADGWAVGNRGTIWKWIGGNLSGPPWATTGATTNIGPSSATLHALITPNGSSTTALFEWGTLNALTNPTLTASQSLGAGTNPLPVTATLSNLVPNTTYFVRATAQNSYGTTKGSVVLFTTSPLAGDPYEPNNSADNATSIAYNFKSSGAELGPAGDVDYYKFNAITGEFVSIEVVTDPDVAGLDVRVQLFDAGGNELAYTDLVSGGTERILYGINQTQSYYIRVVDAADTAHFPKSVGPGIGGEILASSVGSGVLPSKVVSSPKTKRSVLQIGPYTLTLLQGAPSPPQALAAGTGFDGFVPLRWIPPQSNTPMEYRIYRGTSATGPFNLVGTTNLEDFIDLTAANGVTYYYAARSVYAANNSESASSNIEKATPRALGYKTTSKFAFIKATLDGKIRVGEWADAQIDNIGVKRALSTAFSVTMYLKNDDQTLYLAVEDSNANLSTYNRLVVGFDRDLNKKWDNTAPSNEGFIVIDDSAGVPIVRFFAVTGDYPNIQSVDEMGDPKGVVVKFSYEPKSLHYEVALSLGQVGPIATPASAIGLYVAVISEDLNGESPPRALLYAPLTFAEVTLSKPIVPKLPGEYASDAITSILMHMNETSGQFVLDATGNGNNGVATGTTIVDGRFGKARSFNGTSDFILGSSSSLNFGGQDFTLEAWINTSSTASQAIFVANNSVTTTSSNIGIYVAGGAGGGYFDVHINDGQGTSGSNLGGRKVNDGKWHHIAAIRNGSQILLYVDGMLDFQKSITQNPNNSNLFLIGTSSAGALFKGLIDEIRISSKARLPGEFNLQLPPKNLTASASTLTITLNWQNGGGGLPLMRYRIYRGIDSTKVSQIDSTRSTSYTNTGLAAGTKYFYRVSAVDSSGFESAESYAASAATLAVPAPPSLSSPANGATNQPTTPTLSWGASLGAVSYRVQVSAVNTFATTVFDDSTITNTSVQIRTLVNNTAYFWRVGAKNAAGVSGYSTTWSFTTVVAAPASPVLTGPMDGATNQPTTLTLSWLGSVGASSYRVQVSTSNTFTSTVFDDSTITSTSAQVKSLLNNTTYYWRVNAKNVSGISGYSPIWSFTTVVAAPATPNLASPANGATNQPISLTLSWNAVSGAASYRLQVDRTNTFAAPVIDDSAITSTSRLVSSLTNNTTYYWRVSARNAGGTSPFSNTYNFTTVVAAPAAPTLSAPSNNATGLATSVTLGWSSVTGATTYHVQLSTNSSYSGPLVLEDSSITANSRQASGLAENSTYYWRARGKNVGGSGVWSSSFTFSTAGTKAVTSPGVSFPSSPTASTDYRLVSFPGTPSLTVGQILTGSQNTDWRIFRDNSAAVPNNLTELSSSSSLSAGEGYWLLTKGTFNFSKTVTMPQLSQDASYTINVRNGWNIIGNPFDVAVSWGTIRTDNQISANLWTYQGTGGFQTSTTLEPFKGYYFNSGSTSLKIRYPFPSMQILPPAPPVVDWKLQLVLETDANLDAENYIGIAPSAKQELDDLDQPKPPRFFDQGFLYLARQSWGSREKFFSSDFRPSVGDGQVWNFEVCNPKLSKSRIRIVGIETVPPEYDIVLINQGNTVPVDLRIKSEIPMGTAKELMRFNLIIGKKAFVREEEAKLIPKEFELAQNYPNPFNPSTSIVYKVPREVLVKVDVLSVLGQQMATLAEGNHAPGVYTVVWNAGDQSGNRASSGVYFYRLVVDGKVEQIKKMTLLK